MKSLFKTMLKIAIVCLPTLFIGSVKADAISHYSSENSAISQADPNQSDNAESVASNEKDEDAQIEELQSRIEELRVELDNLTERDSDLEAQVMEVANLPTEEYLADSNFVVKGVADVTYAARHHSNETFIMNIFPRFNWRYRDRLLVDSQWIYTTSFGGNFIIETANLAYVVNDYVTVRAGLMYTDIGTSTQRRMLPWIYKMGYIVPTYFRDVLLFPIVTLGADIRGAIPLTCCSECGGIPPVITYSLFVGNGQGQLFGDINNFYGLFPGSLDDNNHEKSVGGRLAYRRLFNEIGVSGMWGRWNNNALGQLTNLTGLPPEVISTRSLNYAAMAGDMDLFICHKYRIMGEYIWTRRDTVPNPFIGIFSDVIYEEGGYLQASALFTDIPFIGSCCEYPDYMHDFEFAVQYSFLDSDRVFIGFRQQWTFALSYYFDPTLIVRAAYAVNRGDFNKNNIFAVTLARAF